MCNSKELNHSIHRQTKKMNVKANHKHCVQKMNGSVIFQFGNGNKMPRNRTHNKGRPRHRKFFLLDTEVINRRPVCEHGKQRRKNTINF